MLTFELPPIPEDIYFPNITVPEFKPEYHSLLKKGKLTYVAGFLAKKDFQKIKACSQCRKDLLSTDRSSCEYFLIETRAYSPNALLAPSTNFNIYFQKCIDILSHILPQTWHYFNISKVLRLTLKSLCHDDIFICEIHNTLNLGEIIIYNYSQNGFFYKGLKQYDELPDFVKNCNNLNSFKRSCTDYIKRTIRL